MATVAACLIFLPVLLTTPELLKKYVRSTITIACAGIVLTYFISLFYGSDLTAFWNVFKNKLPFLFIPLSVLSVGKLEKKQTDLLLYVFLCCCVISSGWSCMQYLQHKDLYTDLYTHGQVMPTLIHHVSLSLLISMGMVICLFQVMQQKSSTEKILLTITGSWLLFFVHLLSVRTGLVLTYLGIALFIPVLAFRFKRPLFAGGLVIVVMITALLAYSQLPTVRHKIAYTFYGIAQYKNGQDSTNQVSDARRILSDKMGLELIQQHPISGVGFGRVQAAMNLLYQQRYPLFPQDVYAHIHNQYVYVFAGAGIPLGILFIACLLLLFSVFLKQHDNLFSILYLMLLLVMLWEPFIENQLGTSIFLCICCWGMLTKTEQV